MEELVIKVNLEGFEKLVDNELCKGYLRSVVNQRVKDAINIAFAKDNWSNELRDEELSKIINIKIKEVLNQENVEEFIEKSVSEKSPAVIQKTINNYLKARYIEERFGHIIDREIGNKIQPIIKEAVKNIPEDEIRKIVERIYKKRITENLKEIL